MPIASHALTILLTLQVLLSEAFRLGIRSTHQKGSPMLPRNCDEVCASQLQASRLLDRSSKAVAAAGTHHHNEARLPTPAASTFHDAAFGEYFAAVATSSGVILHLFFDTGSDMLWIQCRPCVPCYPQTAEIYDGGKSNEGRPVLSDDEFCSSLQRSGYGLGVTDTCCAYRINYVENTWSGGCAVRDTFILTDLDTGGVSTISGVGFGCSTSTHLGMPALTSGTLGLAVGGNNLSLPEQLGMRGYGSSFSYSLPAAHESTAGFLLFGTNSIPSQTRFPTTPFVLGVNARLQYVHVVDILINDVPIRGIPRSIFDWDETTGEGATLIDIGSSFSIVTSTAYIPFRNAWRRALLGLPLGDLTRFGKHLDTCYRYVDKNSLPRLDFVLKGDAMLRTNPSFVYYNSAGELRMCWPYMHEKQTRGTPFVIRAMSLQSIHMIYDHSARRLGWLYGQC